MHLHFIDDTEHFAEQRTACFVVDVLRLRDYSNTVLLELANREFLIGDGTKRAAKRMDNDHVERPRRNAGALKERRKTTPEIRTRVAVIDNDVDDLPVLPGGELAQLKLLLLKAQTIFRLLVRRHSNVEDDPQAAGAFRLRFGLAPTAHRSLHSPDVGPASVNYRSLRRAFPLSAASTHERNAPSKASSSASPIRSVGMADK
ncbi:MAG: hypothetical protein U1E28_02145 [Beijerinckiaceae bacterium]